MKKFLLIALLLLISATTFAQSASVQYIIERDGALTYFGLERNVSMTTDTTQYRPMKWDSSGQYFLTIRPSSEDDLPLVWLFDLFAIESFPLTTDIDIYTGNLFHFSDESLIFTEATHELLISEDEQGIGIQRLNVYEWAFNEGQSTVSAIGNIPFGIGCGGGNVFNALDKAYNAEAHGDTTGQYNQVILEQTPYGIVHSNSCTAIRTYLTQADTMESVELFDNLRWVSVSPDGKFVAGAYDNSLVMIELETLESSSIALADAPIISMVWSADSQHIYYATRTITIGESLDVEDPDGILTINDPYSSAPQADDAQVWQSSLHRYDLSTVYSTVIYTAEAYAIANLSLVGDTLFFSQIETPLAWLQAYVDNPADADSNLIERSYWQYHIEDNQITQLNGDFAGAFIQPR